MGFWESIRKKAAAERIREEYLYEQVANELGSGYRRDGLWAKALTDARGNQERAKGLYIKYRVRSMRDEYEIAEELRKIKELEEIERRREKELEAEEQRKRNEMAALKQRQQKELAEAEQRRQEAHAAAEQRKQNALAEKEREDKLKEQNRRRKERRKLKIDSDGYKTFGELEDYAVKYGYSKAKYLLARLFYKGELVSRDDDLARYWLKRAVAEQYEPAKKALEEWW